MSKLIESLKNKYIGHIKLAVVRSNELRGCPFGLPIPEACNYAGDSIYRMAPIEAFDKEKQASLTKANKLVYINHKTGERCPFADKILENYNKVDCDFGDTGQGEHSVSWQGSPLYPQTFQGLGYEGLYGYPLGFYADNNESRNLFFGLFSFLGKNENINQLIKLANKCDNSGDEKTANKLDNILEDITSEQNQEELKNKMQALENMLAEYKQAYDANRTDSGLLWQLSQKWFGSRQVPR